MLRAVLSGPGRRRWKDAAPHPLTAEAKHWTHRWYREARAQGGRGAGPQITRDNRRQHSRTPARGSLASSREGPRGGQNLHVPPGPQVAGASSADRGRWDGTRETLPVTAARLLGGPGRAA